MAGAFGKLLPVMIKAAPFLFIASMVVAVLHGVSFGVVTMMQQRFFDRAVDAAGGRVGIGQAFLALTLLGITNVACQVLNGVGNFLPDVVDGKVGAHLSMAIQRKIARLDPAVFEDTEKLDDINKAEQGKDAAFWYVSDIIAILTFYVPYFVFMGWYLFPETDFGQRHCHHLSAHRSGAAYPGEGLLPSGGRLGPGPQGIRIL